MGLAVVGAAMTAASVAVAAAFVMLILTAREVVQLCSTAPVLQLAVSAAAASAAARASAAAAFASIEASLRAPSRAFVS